MTGLSQLLGAIALIGLGGLFAAIDAAISTVSLARVHELVRDERPGAMALLKVMAERPRYINLVVLLRITCEITATVLLVVFLYDNFGLDWGVVRRRGHHGGDQLRRHRRGPAHPRSPERVFHLVGDGPSAAGDLVAVDADQPVAGGGG